MLDERASELGWRLLLAPYLTGGADFPAAFSTGMRAATPSPETENDPVPNPA